MRAQLAHVQMEEMFQTAEAAKTFPSNSPPPVTILEPQFTPTAISSTDTSNAITLANEFGKSTTCTDLYALLTDKMGYRSVNILPVRVGQEVRSEGVIFNLCDGCEVDGYPGLSILEYLEKENMAYTGADSAFYRITTDKTILKQRLLDHQVETGKFLIIDENTTEQDVNALGVFPLIVKPSVSYASISISEKSVVHTASEALRQAKAVHGISPGVFVEPFLKGREFTALITGDERIGVHVYAVAERVFAKDLGVYERILGFEKYWEGYDLSGKIPDDPPTLYEYKPVTSEEQKILQDLTKRAYFALEGNGYARVDIRSDDMNSMNVAVLEVNANCGISFNPNEFTSTVGEILKMSGVSVQKFVEELIEYAMKRQAYKSSRSTK